MHKPNLAMLAATALAGGIMFAGIAADAQPAPGAPPMEHPSPMQPGPMHPDWMHGPGGMRALHQRLRQFALIFPAADRALTGADVQKIAEAFLLWNGNHSWKVTDVAEEPDRVTFAFATPDGTVIARFAMNRHTGRPHRMS
jgi:hypothetical protein